MEELEKRQEKFSSLFKDHWKVLLILVLILGVGLRLYYFNIDQAVWWDAADYLTGAKIIGGKISPDINYEFNPRRPFFLPYFWGFLFKLGGNETVLRFTELLFSIAAVILTYLIGKEMFNKKIGIIAAFGMSVFWTHLFYTARLLTGVPATAIWLGMVYFFWKGYEKKEKSQKNILLSGLFAGWGMLTRLTSALALPFLAIYGLIVDRLKFFKNKNIWIALVIALIVVGPFLIYTQTRGEGLGETTRLSERWGNVKGFSGFWEYVDFFYNIRGESFLFLPFFILFIIGLGYILINLILGFDLLIRKKEPELRKYLFLFLWILIFVLNFGAFTGKGNPMQPRYLMYAFPAVFIVMGIGSLKLYDYMKKYSKVFALILVIGLLIFGGFYQVNHAKNLIDLKKTSYYPVKLAGLWLKENSDPNDVVVSESIYQNLYYSERNTYIFNETEEDFNKFVKEKKPKYMIVSVFEPGFTPKWVYTYSERHMDNLNVVQAYFADTAQEQPLLVIYEFRNYVGL